MLFFFVASPHNVFICRSILKMSRLVGQSGTIPVRRCQGHEARCLNFAWMEATKLEQRNLALHTSCICSMDKLNVFPTIKKEHARLYILTQQFNGWMPYRNGIHPHTMCYIHLHTFSNIIHHVSAESHHGSCQTHGFLHRFI